MNPRIGPIRQNAIGKTRKAVYQANDGQYDAKAGLADAIFRREARHRKREILPDEIEQ
jgi:hypothetical protein